MTREHFKKIFNKNNLTNIIITIIFLTLIVIGIILINNKNQQNATAIIDGSITVEIIDINGNELANDMLSYKKGDTLWELIKLKYQGDDLVYNTSSTYGVQLLGIKGIMTDFTSGSYLAIYVNNEYSSLGLSNIVIHDKMVLRIVETEL